jgi:hypothetical protein
MRPTLVGLNHGRLLWQKTASRDIALQQCLAIRFAPLLEY